MIRWIVPETKEDENIFRYDGCFDGHIEVIPYKDGINFEIDQPWAGNSETGFGATLGIRLPIAEAVELAKWILSQNED